MGMFQCKMGGKLFRVNSIMDAKLYKQILVNHDKPSLKQLGSTTFQYDVNPKSTAVKVMKYLTGSVDHRHSRNGLQSL